MTGAEAQSQVQLPASWLDVIGDFFETPTMKQLRAFLVEEMKQSKVFPPAKLIFNALNLTPFDKVKVVILGQDPYHNDGQAHGLCFSVPRGTKPPPSLENIFKELMTDVGMQPPHHGELTSWARQGILLLNAVLTVRAHQAGSHAGRGWEEFTDRIIMELGKRRENLVFLLWGSYAQKKAAHIDGRKHLILKAPHPSPLSAYRGFMGCRHFSQANQYLTEHGLEPIEWSLPD